MSTDETQFVHSFIKRPGEKIQIALRKFKGKYYVDLRLWFQRAEDKTFLPSRKGIAFELEHLPEFRRGIEELIRAAAGLRNKSAEGSSASRSGRQAERFNKLYSNQRSE